MENMEEKTLLLDRKYRCPVCQLEIKAKSVKSGAAKLIDTGMDLRPMYHNIDVVKYDTVSCPQCGYSALTKYFSKLTPVQKKNVEEKVCSKYQPHPAEETDIYDYPTALARYKLALLCTVMKVAEPSETGYVCLKLSWLYEAMEEALIKEGGLTQEEMQKTLDEYHKEGDNFRKNALDSMLKARMEEEYPICGMDMPTLDYLISALSYQCGEYDQALRMLGYANSSKEASDRLKDKAYELKQVIIKAQKEQE